MNITQSETNMVANVNYALRYAELGLHVFPCEPNGKDPLEGLMGGFRNATLDAEQIRQWWSKNPSANIGCYPGASGLVVVDVDIKDGGMGMEQLEALEFAHSLLPDAPISITPSKGKHLLFAKGDIAQDGVIITNTKLADDIDIRADNGYILLEPSTTPDGNYSFIDWDVLTDGAPIFPVIPGWVLDEQAKRIVAVGNGNASDLEPISSIDGLSDEVMDKFSRLIGKSSKAKKRFEGSTEGLKDTSGSGMDMSMASILKSAGFTYLETVALLINWNFGSKSPDRKGDRYWERIWTRSVVEMSAQERRRQQQDRDREIGEGTTYNPNAEMLTISEMEERFIFLSFGSRVFDRKNVKHIIPFNDFKNLTSGSTMEVFNPATGKDRTLKTSTVWLSSPSRLGAHSVTFRAGHGEFTSDPLGHMCVNTWRGFAHRVDPDGVSPQPFIDHIEYLFGERADDFLNWLAHIEQCPGVLPHQAWLHVSSRTGSGRGWLGGVLARVWEGHVASGIDLQAMLTTGFNGRLSGKLLSTTDEIKVGGAGKWAHAEKLKELITAEERAINEKYGRISVEYNACRWLMFSNHRMALPIDYNDRRVEVRINDESPRDSDYYSKLYAMREDPRFISAVAKYFGERDISGYNAGQHSKHTDDRRQVIQSGQSEELTTLLQATEAYPYQLATYPMLKAWAGLDATASAADNKSFSHAVVEAGWIRVGRKKWSTTHGQREEYFYAKAEYSAGWMGKLTYAHKFIPSNWGGEKDPFNFDPTASSEEL